MNLIAAIDPGNEVSAFLEWDGERIHRKAIAPNEEVLKMLSDSPSDLLYIEKICSYGMAVGAEVFDTCFWYGRFAQRWEELGGEFILIPRGDIKLHHCHSRRAKDPNVRQALVDKYGKPGTKKSPGVTYGVSSHLWSAFALATMISEKINDCKVTA